MSPCVYILPHLTLITIQKFPQPFSNIANNRVKSPHILVNSYKISIHSFYIGNITSILNYINTERFTTGIPYLYVDI
ncbi:hypothetical protein ATK78_0121 [Pedobacter metabolipauper]|uniref:Uncharacterized protein n=1 Tax=Pedobacter metabolipauper TaxID=425513 RepID=A0A4R6SZ08_9SPHI|nr:hypothetical protein ATK78_0121 [Pedobacter metabolipauper]